MELGISFGAGGSWSEDENHNFAVVGEIGFKGLGK